jgi:hypothetical protein
VPTSRVVDLEAGRACRAGCGYVLSIPYQRPALYASCTMRSMRICSPFVRAKTAG